MAKTSLNKKSPMNKSSSAAKNPIDAVLNEETLRQGVDTMHGFYPRVWVSLGQKIQVRDYEPVEIHFGYSVDLKGGDNVDNVVDGMIKFVKAKIKPLIMKAMESKKHNKKQ